MSLQLGAEERGFINDSRIHEPIPLQGKWLTQVVRRYFAYHDVPTIGPSLVLPARILDAR
jgi:hypothetical protein